MKSLVEFKSIVEEEKSDYSKFDTLVRAGLANKAQMQRIHKILDKMGEEKPQFNNADRMIIQNLFNRMVDLISNNKQINTQARRAVKEEVETEEPIILQEDKDPPMVLVIKRKAIRMYPDGTRIALYFNERLNKYFSVPYNYGSGMDAAIQAEGNDICSVCGQTPCNCTHIEEAVMDQLHKIVNDKQAQSVKFASGHTRKVDHFTASALTQVHKALNDENKKKFADLVHKSPEHFMKASDFAFKHAK